MSCSGLCFILNAENIMQRKCRAHKKTLKIFRSLREFFFVRFLVFHVCTTFKVRDFFLKFSSAKHLRILKQKNSWGWQMTWKFEANMKITIYYF